MTLHEDTLIPRVNSPGACADLLTYCSTSTNRKEKGLCALNSNLAEASPFFFVSFLEILRFKSRSSSKPGYFIKHLNIVHMHRMGVRTLRRGSRGSRQITSLDIPTCPVCTRAGVPSGKRGDEQLSVFLAHPVYA